MAAWRKSPLTTQQCWQLGENLRQPFVNFGKTDYSQWKSENIRLPIKYSAE